MTRKRTAASGHVGIDFTLIGVRHNVPPYGRGPLAYIFPGVILVKSFHGVVAQRRVKGSLHNSLFQQDFQFIDKREGSAALHPELEYAGVLAGGTVQLHRQLLIAEHGIVNGLG